MRTLIALLAGSLFFCGTAYPDSTRTFRLGFSSWPYDATTEAVEWTWKQIFTSGDAFSNHLDEGVPWTEALNNQPFPTPYEQELTDRLNRAISAKKESIVSITPLNTLRTGLAYYRGDTPGEPLPETWANKSLDSKEVTKAYTNYALRIAEKFQPKIMLIGIEVNLFLRHSPSSWPKLVSLLKRTAKSIKTKYPSIKVGVSVFSVPYFPEYSLEDNLRRQKRGLKDLESFCDIIAFSVHPFMSGLFAERLPPDYFDRLFSLTSKPKMISESSYPAQEWSTTINGTEIPFNGSLAKQNNFVKLMLRAATKHKLAAVFYFAIRDYDALWSGLLNRSNEALIWRDTGLYDEEGAERPALNTWRNFLRKPYKN